MRILLTISGVSFSYPSLSGLSDMDGDGIPDYKDGAPTEAEDIDGYEDENGIPDYDNDGDGINDIDDDCPLNPEDIDGFMDDDGCPDIDNDNDGAIDYPDDFSCSSPQDDDEENQGHGAGASETGRRCETLVEEVVDQDLGAVLGPSRRRRHQVDQAEGLEADDGAHDEDVEGGRAEHGPGDVTESVPPVRSVNLSRLVKLPRNALQGARGHNHHKGDAKPHVCDDNRNFGPERIGKPRDRADSYHLQHLVYRPKLLVKHPLPDKGRYETRHRPWEDKYGPVNPREKRILRVKEQSQKYPYRHMQKYVHRRPHGRPAQNPVKVCVDVK